MNIANAIIILTPLINYTSQGIFFLSKDFSAFSANQ